MDKNQQTPGVPAPTPSAAPEIEDYSKPVAWDQYGRPLYARPNDTSPQQMVHISRAINPAAEPIPEDIKQKAIESQKKYPNLNLSDGEYVIHAVRRHPIGVLQIWAVVIFIMVAFGVLFAVLANNGAAGAFSLFGSSEEITSLGALVMLLLFSLTVGGGFIATYIYNANRFYLTNESVIQEIQTGLFSKHEQTVSLMNIEDASYRQNGIIQTMLNYGSIRLSTEGDETTYRFNYVTNPKFHIATLNNAVEAFKNGRPVHH